MEQAHRELVKRLLSPQGLLYDYVGELPTAVDCAECRPNAMGWWSPIENGPMFTGPWLGAVCARAKERGQEEDRTLCRKLAEGLLLSASVSDVPGMVVRGFGADGRCHYPLGSADQTVPWFFGLWAYVKSGLAEPAFRTRIVNKMVSVGRELEKLGWMLPCDGPFKGEFRGGIATDLPFRASTHYLFVLMALYDVTGDLSWREKYRQAREGKCEGLNLTRLEVCARGMMIDKPKFPQCDGPCLWIYLCAQGCLRELMRMEDDPVAKAAYRKGLDATAEVAMRRFKPAELWKNEPEVPFKYANWRTGYSWRVQRTQKDAAEVADSGKREILGTRKGTERDYMSNPLAAAAICAYAGRNQSEIARLLRRYDYSLLNISEFFAAEVAWFEGRANVPPEPLMVEIDPSERGIPIASTFFGVFYEDVNGAADGGLYAEMVKNRSFESRYDWMGWQPFGEVTLEKDGPFGRCPKYVRLLPLESREARSGLRNEGFGRGMLFRKGSRYRFSVWARQKDGGTASLAVNLCDPHSLRKTMYLGGTNLTVVGLAWKKYEAELIADADCEAGALDMMLNGTSSVDLEHVSVFPSDTWRGGVLRADIAQAIADLKPGVLRFPGGCIVEGTTLAGRYDWKKSVGPVENRPPTKNIWCNKFATRGRVYPDYDMTYGIGFYELFVFAEQLGAEPLPVVNCGLACQNELRPPKQSAKGDLSYMRQFIDDAVDLVEFANGDASTKWGRLRAEMGHLAPFNLKYLGIGNEQFDGKDDPIYTKRLKMIADAVRTRWPEVEIVASVARPACECRCETDRFADMGIDWVDEHWYNSADWVQKTGLRFDAYDRHGPKIYAGEYACLNWDEMGRLNDFGDALGEAAFMTTMERNADVVKMSSYAPTLLNLDAWQWMPSMIWFDRKGITLTPSYQIQKLFADNRGAVSLKALANGKPLAGQPEQEGLFVSAVRTASGDLVVKVVNRATDPKTLCLKVNGASFKSTNRTVVTKAGLATDSCDLACPLTVQAGSVTVFTLREGLQ